MERLILSLLFGSGGKRSELAVRSGEPCDFALAVEACCLAGNTAKYPSNSDTAFHSQNLIENLEEFPRIHAFSASATFCGCSLRYDLSFSIPLRILGFSPAGAGPSLRDTCHLGPSCGGVGDLVTFKPRYRQGPRGPTNGGIG